VPPRRTEAPLGAVAIVTGGSSGAGRELVDALVGRGFAVVLVYLRDRCRAETVVEDVRSRGGAALAVRADAGDERDVERVFDEATLAFGGVDMIVHVAPRAADVVLDHAERRLRWGGATITVSCTVEVGDALSRVDRWTTIAAG
jgi:NAD(P)-dependent dehydrogenase (short-subunit alcohol dehydrogenase family)